METTQSESEPEASVPLVLPVLPSIDQEITAARPQTCESSATTVPPPVIHNNEATSEPRLEIPAASLPPVHPKIRDDHSQKHSSPIATTTQAPPPNPGQSCTPDIDKELKATEARTDQTAKQSQKKKRRAPQQPRKTKLPRSGPSQTTLRKRGGPSIRHKQSAKGQQVSTNTKAIAQNSIIRKGENADLTEKVGCPVYENVSPSKQTSDNAAKSQTKVVECKRSESITGQPRGSSSTIVKEGVKANFTKKAACPINKSVSPIMQPSSNAVTSPSKVKGCKASETINGQVGDSSSRPSEGSPKPTSVQALEDGSTKLVEIAAETCKEVVTPAEKEQQQPVEREDKLMTSKTPSTTVADTGKWHNHKEGSDRRKSSNKTNAERKDEPTLEEKYEALSRRYQNLINELLSSSKTKSEESDDSESEGAKVGKDLIVDRKVYDTIYLCKLAGMLGALKIEGGPSKFVKPRVEEVENPYKRVVMDGFAFVEDLMTMGEGDESCMKSVVKVFRDLHIRLLVDVWEKQHTQAGGKTLVKVILKSIVDQVKNWYTKIIDNKICIRWCETICEELVERVLKRLTNMDERLTEEVVKMHHDTLKGISEMYQKAEKGVKKASLDMFCNSCEVSICVARSVPEAVFRLDEEDVFAIGRHNGVFAHCVARLVAERDMDV